MSLAIAAHSGLAREVAWLLLFSFHFCSKKVRGRGGVNGGEKVVGGVGDAHLCREPRRPSSARALSYWRRMPPAAQWRQISAGPASSPSSGGCPCSCYPMPTAAVVVPM